MAIHLLERILLRDCQTMGQGKADFVISFVIPWMAVVAGGIGRVGLTKLSNNIFPA
jgi:hypothetical protein